MLSIGSVGGTDSFSTLSRGTYSPPLHSRLTSTGSSSLRSLRSQNHFAAVTIQRVVRGFVCRRILWGRNGLLTNRAATKIQKTFRMHLGRKNAFERGKFMIYTHASRIQNLNKIFKAKQQLRVLRAEKTLERLILMQRKFRDRKERKLFRLFILKMKDNKCRQIQRALRGHNGRRRFKAIEARLHAKFLQLTRAVKSDAILSQNFTVKVTASMIDVTACRDAWSLLDFAITQFVGTNRQTAYLNCIMYVARRYPDFFFGRFFLCVILLFVWTAMGSQRVVVEDILAEALELSEYLKGESEIFARNFGEDEDDLPPSLRGVDVYSLYENRYGNEPRYMMEEVLEEFEMSYFRCAFRRHGYTEVTFSQMAIFLIVRSVVTQIHAVKLRCLERARILLRNARKKASSKAFEEMHLRIDLFDEYFGQDRKLILRRKRNFKDCVLSDWVRGQPAQIYRKGGRDDRLKLNVELDFFHHGDMIVVYGTVISSISNRSASSRVDLPCSSQPTSSKKWNESILIRPLVLLSRDVKALIDHSVAFVAKILHQSEDDVSRRGKWNILAEFLFHEIRIVSSECRHSKENKLPTSERRDNLFSRARITLPVLDYRHRERNSQLLEEYGLKLMQRTYRGFRGRSLWRRLNRRKLTRMSQQETTQSKLTQIIRCREHRYIHASKIQAHMRGYLWRKELSKYNRAAINCQRMYRGHAGRKKVKALVRRRLLGAPVHEMIRRGVILDELRITLIIYRCGLNYRVLGQDHINNCEYHGNVWQQEVDEFLEIYNSQFSGNSIAAKQQRVMPWQHMRVAELILGNLSLTSKIPTATKEFGAGSKRGIKALVFMKSAPGPGIGQTSGLQRGLKDTLPVLKKLERIEQRKQAELAAAELRYRKEHHHHH